MSESESENESDLDFSASEDEYVPSADEDSESDDYQNQSIVDEPQPSSSKQKAKGKRKVATRKNYEDDDDSDSSVDNYLVNPNDIDLSSDFFNPTKKTVVPDAPKFDCNVGLKLSDSEEEVFEAVPSTSQAAYVELADFEADQRRQKAIREMVENLKQFEANNYGFGNSEMVRKVLGLGEPALAATKSPQSKRKERLSSSDESDFEEVEEKVTTDKKSDVEVRIEPANKQKVNKLQAEIEASIKRKINRRKKESQLMMHKVHVLSWIAYGNYVNKILNSTKLMEMVVKYIPSEKCYPKEKTDEQFFQQIVKWYKTTVGLKSNEQNCPLKCLPPIATSLALQIQSKMAICKKDFVFVFIILLRSMGIQCRLVINLATVPMRPAVKDLCVISTKTADKPAKSSSGDKAKTDKKSKKTAKVSSQDKNVVKGSTASKTKLKSRANSISGTKSEIVMEEDSNRMEPVVDKKKKLKRSVSVQSSSSINDNNKRSRSSSKANIAPKVGSSTKNGTNATVNNQTASVQKPTSTTSEASKLSLNEQKSIPSTETDTVRPRISNRTKQILARKSSGAVLSNIPQLDGGDDKKSKKPKANLFKIRLPPRARSVSPSSSGVASVKPSRGRAQSSAPKSIPQPDSTSAASEHAVRKSELDKSNDSAPSAAESLPKSEMSLLEPKSPKSGAPEAPSATTSKPKRRTLYTSPTKTWLHRDRPKTVVAEHQKVADTQPVQLGSSTESTTKSLSKQAANTDKKSPSASNDTMPISKDSTISPSKLTASSKRSNSKTKSSNPAKKLRSQSVEPSANVAAATVSPSKSSKESNPKTKSSHDKKLRSRSKEPAAIPITATESTASSKKSNSKTKSSNPEKGRRSRSAEPSSDATVSSSQDKKLRSRSKESAPPTATTTESITKSATSSKRSKSKTKSSNPAKKLRSKSVEPSANVATASTSKSSASSKKSNSKTKSSDPVAGPSMNSSKPSSSSKQSKSKPNAKSSTVETLMKTVLKRKATISISSDSDFAPTPKKKLSTAGDRPLPKQVDKLKKRIDRRILSSDDESVEPAVKKEDMNYWIEVYCEAESKWICIDLFKMKVNCVDEVKKKATKPIAYVFAWNNNNKIKDVSPRYCSQWNTTTRKLRVQPDWLDEALSRYKEPLSQRCVAEDRELQEIHAQTPIPSSISELKNHPLYVLPRHLLKFEGIYPPNPVPVGFIREEPIYSRLCVHTLHSREIWVKQARVVKPGENPYKIVKARPKWDRLANKMLECQPLEIFGRWQTEPYVPPTAENGIVPRNAYGNVELFKPEMLPKKTVHLRLAGLNRVCAKLKIDCAQAVVGFDFHGGSSHPTFDGFVVCEEFAELVTERWCEEQEEAHRKAKEKQNQRVYDNWKKLVKGLLIRERLQRKYNFAGKMESKGT